MCYELTFPRSVLFWEHSLTTFLCASQYRPLQLSSRLTHTKSHTKRFRESHFSRFSHWVHLFGTLVRAIPWLDYPVLIPVPPPHHDLTIHRLLRSDSSSVANAVLFFTRKRITPRWLDTLNRRQYDHSKHIDEGITPLVVQDLDRPSFVV